MPAFRLFGLALASLLLLAGTLDAQVLNDDCDQAINNGFFLNAGSNSGTNVGATVSGVNPNCGGIGGLPVIGVGSPVDVWYAFTATTTCTFRFEMTGTSVVFPLLVAYDGNSYSGAGSCGNLPELNCVPAPSAGTGGTELLLTLSAGDLVLFQVISLLGDTGSIVINVAQGFSLTIDSPAGSGSLSISNQCGTPSGSYVTAITLSPGGFPQGWFFGIDIPIIALTTEINFGVPFFGALDASGNSSWSVPAGIPPGLNLYAVSVELDANFLPVLASEPITYLTP